MSQFDRIHLVVLDSVGIGAARRTHENFLFILLCPDINFEKIPF
ncbi:hypothetical protein SAG0110_01515 [Streptococcus agalactiae BSU167]|nr:hypothetical protein SAG0110_01515 [Streptococcus agalactiae BSU167]